MFDDPLSILMASIPITCSILAMIWAISGISPEEVVNFIAKKLAQKAHLTKIDFEKTKKEYKDILYNYSITELRYIDNFEINLKREIVSTLLNLELKNKIEITDKQIKIINYDEYDLKLTEKDVFHWIKDGKVKIQDEKYCEQKLEHDALNEAIEAGLLCKMNNGIKQQIKLNYILIFLIVAIIVGVFLLGCFKTVTNYDSGKFPIIISYICSGIVTIFLPIYILFVSVFVEIFREYDRKMRYTYERTSYGNSINEKIEGLKKYIKEYSLLDEREKQALIVWEEYLIYSVAFNQNKKVSKKLLELVDIEKFYKKIFTPKAIIEGIIVFAIYMICGVLWKQFAMAIAAIITFIVGILLLEIVKNKNKE